MISITLWAGAKVPVLCLHGVEQAMVEQLQVAHIGGFLGILGCTFIIRQHESNEVNKKLMPLVCYRYVLHFLEGLSLEILQFRRVTCESTCCHWLKFCLLYELAEK